MIRRIAFVLFFDALLSHLFATSLLRAQPASFSGTNSTLAYLPATFWGIAVDRAGSVYVACSSPQVMKVTPAGGQSFLLTQVAVDHAVAGPVHPSCSEHHGVRSSPQQGDHRNSGRHIYHYRNGVVRKSQSQCEPHTQCKLIQRLNRMGSPPKGGLYF